MGMSNVSLLFEPPPIQETLIYNSLKYHQMYNLLTFQKSKIIIRKKSGGISLFNVFPKGPLSVRPRNLLKLAI